jgi:hypothetical protein
MCKLPTEEVINKQSMTMSIQSMIMSIVVVMVRREY